MSMIIFVNHLNSSDVLLDDKLVGEIRYVNGKWQYFPKGKRNGGERFDHWKDCKKDVAGDTSYKNC